MSYLILAIILINYHLHNDEFQIFSHIDVQCTDNFPFYSLFYRDSSSERLLDIEYDIYQRSRYGMCQTLIAMLNFTIYNHSDKECSRIRIESSIDEKYSYKGFWMDISMTMKLCSQSLFPYYLFDAKYLRLTSKINGNKYKVLNTPADLLFFDELCNFIPENVITPYPSPTSSYFLKTIEPTKSDYSDVSIGKDKPSDSYVVITHEPVKAGGGCGTTADGCPPSPYYPPKPPSPSLSPVPTPATPDGPTHTPTPDYHIKTFYGDSQLYCKNNNCIFYNVVKTPNNDGQSKDLGIEVITYEFGSDDVKWYWELIVASVLIIMTTIAVYSWVKKVISGMDCVPSIYLINIGSIFFFFLFPYLVSSEEELCLCRDGSLTICNMPLTGSFFFNGSNYQISTETTLDCEEAVMIKINKMTYCLDTHCHFFGKRTDDYCQTFLNDLSWYQQGSSSDQHCDPAVLDNCGGFWDQTCVLSTMVSTWYKIIDLEEIHRGYVCNPPTFTTYLKEFKFTTIGYHGLNNWPMRFFKFSDDPLRYYVLNSNDQISSNSIKIIKSSDSRYREILYHLGKKSEYDNGGMGNLFHELWEGKEVPKFSNSGKNPQHNYYSFSLDSALESFYGEGQFVTLSIDIPGCLEFPKKGYGTYTFISNMISLFPQDSFDLGGHLVSNGYTNNISFLLKFNVTFYDSCFFSYNMIITDHTKTIWNNSKCSKDYVDPVIPDYDPNSFSPDRSSVKHSINSWTKFIGWIIFIMVFLHVISLVTTISFDTYKLVINLRNKHKIKESKKFYRNFNRKTLDHLKNTDVTSKTFSNSIDDIHDDNCVVDRKNECCQFFPFNLCLKSQVQNESSLPSQHESNSEESPDPFILK